MLLELNCLIIYIDKKTSLSKSQQLDFLRKQIKDWKGKLVFILSSGVH